MTIGEKIKELRQKNDVTQEKLAEYLRISSQSVSKWECGNALPDIGMLIPLANFFGVSVDEILCRSSETEAADVDASIWEGNKLFQLGKYDEDLALWREKASLYPRNFECMRQLAHTLQTQAWRRHVTPEERDEYIKESISLCERILNECTDSSIRGSALQILVFTYSNRNSPFADEEKAIKYAEMADSCYTCNEVLLEAAYFTDEHKQDKLWHRHNNILNFLDFVSCRIVYESRDSDEEYILAQNAALTLWETVIPDGNYLFYHSRVGEIHDNLARRYAKMGNREKTLEHLRLAFFHAAAFDNIPFGVESYFTSMFVSAASSNRGDYPSIVKSIKHDFETADCFDFIRDDPEFVALMDEYGD